MERYNATNTELAFAHKRSFCIQILYGKKKRNKTVKKERDNGQMGYMALEVEKVNGNE